jgi:hypothetical protein
MSITVPQKALKNQETRWKRVKYSIENVSIMHSMAHYPIYYFEEKGAFPRATKAGFWPPLNA